MAFLKYLIVGITCLSFANNVAAKTHSKDIKLKITNKG